MTNFAELVGNFQLALYRHYNSGGQSLFQPDVMRRFCQAHSPHLFDILLGSITRADGRLTSKEHTNLQEQRIVGLLHTLAYFRYFNLNCACNENISASSCLNKIKQWYSNIIFSGLKKHHIFRNKLECSFPCMVWPGQHRLQEGC